MRMRQRDRGVNRGASPGKARLRRGLSACLGPWVAFAAAGCGGGDETLAGAAGVRRLSSDLVHVVGTSDSIAAVKDLQVPSDGSVWVLSTQAPHFVGFRSNGELIAAHGGAGGGPEEFAAPAAFVTGWDDEAWVFDYRRHGLIHVSRPEGLWTESTLPRDVLPPGTLVGGMGMMEINVRTARLGEEVVVARSQQPTEPGITGFRLAILGADLVAWDPVGGTTRTILTLGDVLDDPAAGFEATEGGFPLWYRLWTVCGDDTPRGPAIYVYDRTRGQVRRFASDGGELEALSLPDRAFDEVTPRQFADAVYPLRAAEVTGRVSARLDAADSVRLMAEMLERVQGSPAQLAAYLPRYVDPRCGDAGSAWIQPYGLDAGGLAGSSTWLEVGLDGRRRSVRFPEGFDPYRFQDGRVWGIQRDALDVPSVAWIALPVD